MIYGEVRNLKPACDFKFTLNLEERLFHHAQGHHHSYYFTYLSFEMNVSQINNILN